MGLVGAPEPPAGRGDRANAAGRANAADGANDSTSAPDSEIAGQRFGRNRLARASDGAESESGAEGFAACREAAEHFSALPELSRTALWQVSYALCNLTPPALELPADASRRRLLVLGKGMRFFAPMMAREGWAVSACDPNGGLASSIEALAEREGLPLEFHAEQPDALRYPSRHFAAIACIASLRADADADREFSRPIAELARVLDADGRLVVTFELAPGISRSWRQPGALSLPDAVELMDALEAEFQAADPGRSFFEDRALLEDPRALENDGRLLRSATADEDEPRSSPWRWASRGAAALERLVRDRGVRSRAERLVGGLVLRKGPEGPAGVQAVAPNSR